MRAESQTPVSSLSSITMNPYKMSHLKALQPEVIIGYLKDRRSLDAACRGVTAVISTASSTLSRQEGDSIESVDRQGQVNLVDAAEAVGVKHFVLISFPNVDIDFPLQIGRASCRERV